MLNRVVTYVKCHATLFIPGAGNLDSTLPPKSRTVPCEMKTTEAGVYTKIGATEFVVPYANIIVLQLGPEESKAPAKKWVTHTAQ